MRRSLLAATAVIGLVFAPSVWAQQGGAGTGASPGGAPGAGGAEMRGGAGGAIKGPQGEDMGGGKSGEMREQGGEKMRQGGDDMRGDKKGAERDRGETAKGAEQDRGDRSKGAEREGGGAKLSSEQQTKVRSGFHGASVREARDINVTHVTVGASIPRTVVDYWEPVPASIVEVVPAWRAYKVVRIRGDIVVIDPDTFEIVYVM